MPMRKRWQSFWRRIHGSVPCITPVCRAIRNMRWRGARCEDFGGVVSFEIAGDLEATSRVVDACRIPQIAPSLGGVESLDRAACADEFL